MSDLGSMLFTSMGLDSLPHDKPLDWKVFSDDISCVAYMMKSVCNRVENIVGKGENAGYQHFLLFPQCFRKSTISGSLKVGIMRYRVKRILVI